MTSGIPAARRGLDHRYRFENRWRLDAGYDTIFNVLADPATYLLWWPACTFAEMADDGSCAAELRGRLPFTLRFRLHPDTVDRQAGVLRSHITGDMDGVVQWTVRAASETRTDVDFHQAVELQHRLGRVLDPLLRPLFRWNHDAAMAGGERGLRDYLRRNGSA